MSKSIRVLLAASITIILLSSNLFAISKVAARYNVMGFTVSSAQPHGSYGRIGIGNYEVVFLNEFNQPFEFDADKLYDNSFAYGLNYGRLINKNTVFNVGFSFVDAEISDEFKNFFSVNSYMRILRLRMYNVDFNWNYYFMSPINQGFAPYAGVGLQAGLLSASVKGFSSESDFVMATAFNFGVDLTVWKAKNKMSTLALSSVNTYQFYASDSRPKYMTFGLGLKYFFRP